MATEGQPSTHIQGNSRGVATTFAVGTALTGGPRTDPSERC